MRKKNTEPEVEVRFYDAASTSSRAAADPKKYASKETVNLCRKDRKDISLATFCLSLAIILIFLILIEFFFAYLPYRRLEDAEDAFAAERAQYQQLVDGMSDFDEVQEEYRKYNYENFDRTVVDREEVLDLLEETVFSYGKISSLRIETASGSGELRNRVRLDMTEVPATKVGEMVDLLYEHEMVERVSVSSENIVGGKTSVNMTIYLKDAKGGK